MARAMRISPLLLVLLLLVPSLAPAQMTTTTAGAPSVAPATVTTAGLPALAPVTITTAGAPAAATPSPTPTPRLAGAIEAGATVTSGNTHVETYSGALRADGRLRKWGLAVRASGVYAETRNVQTAGAWDASVRGERTLYGKLSAYARLSIDGDRFKGIENRKGAGAGLSAQHAWKADGFDRHVLRAETGYQFFREDLVGTAEDRDVHAARAFGGYRHGFSKESTFSQEVETLYDFANDDRVLLVSVTSLAVKLRANLAFKVSETIKLDTEPPLRDPATPALGRYEKLDTLTAFAVILTF